MIINQLVFKQKEGELFISPRALSNHLDIVTTMTPKAIKKQLLTLCTQQPQQLW